MRRIWLRKFELFAAEPGVERLLLERHRRRAHREVLPQQRPHPRRPLLGERDAASRRRPGCSRARASPGAASAAASALADRACDLPLAAGERDRRRRAACRPPAGGSRRRRAGAPARRTTARGRRADRRRAPSTTRGVSRAPASRRENVSIQAGSRHRLAAGGGERVPLGRERVEPLLRRRRSRRRGSSTRAHPTRRSGVGAERRAAARRAPPTARGERRRAAARARAPARCGRR